MHTYTQTFEQIHTHKYTHPYTYAYIYIHTQTHTQTYIVDSIICWSPTPEHETCPGVVDIHNVILLEKIDFSSSLSRYN